VSSTSSRSSSAGRAGAAAIALLLVAGCSLAPPAGVPALPAGTPAVELTATPFFPQTAWQCGPAALATALGASGVAADPAALATQVYLPARRGSLQVEMVAATRRAGRVPWLLSGDLPALAREVAAGHPVLVLQDVGRLGLRRWHYAVAVGLDPGTDSLVLRSGREPRRREPAARFARSWAASDHWGLVVLPPGVLPATATPDLTLATLAAAEGLLPARDLHASWTAAEARFPADPAVAFGAANAARAAGDAAAAEAALRRSLALAPDYLPALNNLADLLLDAGCGAEARALAARAGVASEQAGTPAAWRTAVADTQARAAACAPAR
jgi:hypothetical protein